MLGNVEGELSADPKSLPCLLQKLDKDGSVIKDTPGYMVSTVQAGRILFSTLVVPGLYVF